MDDERAAEDRQRSIEQAGDDELQEVRFSCPRHAQLAEDNDSVMQEGAVGAVELDGGGAVEEEDQGSLTVGEAKGAVAALVDDLDRVAGGEDLPCNSRRGLGNDPDVGDLPRAREKDGRIQEEGPGGEEEGETAADEACGEVRDRERPVDVRE
eukprot:764923-Hanusia_phi.AAC.1